MSARGGSAFGGKKTIAIISCLFFILSAGLIVCPQPTQAAEPLKFTPQIEIPGADKIDSLKPTKEDGKTAYTVDGNLIGSYIKLFYNYAIGIVGILAAVVLMWGGVVWLTSGGSAERVKSAKEWIGAALSGLVLVLTSYLILSTINPDLVSFKSLNITETVEFEEGCCEYKDDNGYSLAAAYSSNKCGDLKGTFSPDKFLSADKTSCTDDGCCYIETTDNAYDACFIKNKTDCNALSYSQVESSGTSKFMPVASCEKVPECAGIIK